MAILDRIQQILTAELNARNSASKASGFHQVTLDDLDTDQALRDAIDKAVADVKSQPTTEVSNACRVLDIHEQFNAHELKAAWRKALMKWHPDLFVNASPKDQEQAASMTRSINAAYFFLRSRV